MRANGFDQLDVLPVERSGPFVAANDKHAERSVREGYGNSCQGSYGEHRLLLGEHRILSRVVYDVGMTCGKYVTREGQVGARMHEGVPVAVTESVARRHAESRFGAQAQNDHEVSGSGVNHSAGKATDQQIGVERAGDHGRKLADQLCLPRVT